MEFGYFKLPGEYVKVRTLKNSAIRACPHVIFNADHYREDESCRCNDPDHTEMSEWGYTWDDKKGQWVGEAE